MAGKLVSSSRTMSQHIFAKFYFSSFCLGEGWGGVGLKHQEPGTL
jgi:hypothetical protein